jgi:glycosyltransferase involved in cell wall biosynthesis
MTDTTADILRAFADRDRRIRIVTGSRNGLGLVRNLLIREASAPLIAWLDSDDVAYPTRLEKQVALMMQNPDLVGAGTSVRVIDEDGDVIKEDIRPADHATIDCELIDYKHNAIFFPSSIVRADALETVGGFRAEFPVACDTDLWLRLSEAGRLTNTSEILLDYRWHAQSNSWTVPAWQSERAVAAINDARKRRRMPPLSHVASVPNRVSRGAVHDAWAATALTAGNYRTARKHALRALCRNPFLSKSWQTIALGTFPLEYDRSGSRFLQPGRAAFRWTCFQLSALTKRLARKTVQ